MSENFYEANEQQNPYYQNPIPTPPQEEKANVGLAILSFIIPLVGLILFLTKKNDKPKTAKACGICALVSFLLGIVSSIIMTVAGGALFGAALDEALDDPAYTQDGGSITAEGTIVEGNTLGDYDCVVKGAQLTKDYEGKDAVIITYEFTNNSSEAASFDTALMDYVYQNGIELESAYLSDDDIDVFDDTKIKPGVTKETKKAYILNDTTNSLEVEITEFFSFTNDKIVTTIELG